MSYFHNSFNNMNTFSLPEVTYQSIQSSNIYTFNQYSYLNQSAIMNAAFVTASNTIITSNLNCEALNVNKDIYANAISGLSNVRSSNYYCESNITIRNSRYILGGPSFNSGSDSSTVNTGIDLFGQSKNYMIYVARSSNFVLNNSPAGVNSCAGVNFSSYAMRFRVNNGTNFGFIFQDKLENPLFTINGDGLVYASSNIGIGKANAGYQLDLSTDGARKLTNTTWTTGSDQRIKTNIEDADLDVCYSNIRNINLKRFKWDSNVIGPVEDETMLGFIAQEIKEVFPKSVNIIPDYGFDDFHNLNQDQLNKCLFGAVKKLIQKVEALEETILNNVVLK